MASIAIEASSPDVWDALVNPATAKACFFWAKVQSDWIEGSPITFTGELPKTTFQMKGKRARSDQFWSGVLSTIKGSVESGT